jgi:UDP:flavonoid glycosyltransferase YjiC (YdhE family)
MRTSIDPDALRSAIETALADPSYARTARALSAEMAEHPTTDEALATLAVG